MHASSHQLGVTDSDGSALEFLSKNSFASQITTRLAISHGRPDLKEFEDEYFAALVAHCPNLVALHLRMWNFDSVRPHLLAECSFPRLGSLTISCEATLTVAGFFGMLSLMPALKRLWLGRVEGEYASDNDSNDSPVREPDANLATPACSLTHVVVGDDWSINFWHYEHLLSRSHATLEHLELHWIYDESVGDAVARALERCTRVHHLTLIGNDFTNERIIAAAGATVGSLTLVYPPTDAEFAVMRAPLRALELVNCYVADPESFVASAWEKLRDRLPTAPMLRRIRFSLMKRPVSPEAEGLRKLRKACKERRIVLSLHPGLYGLAF